MNGLTVKQVAQRLQVSEGTVRSMIREGRIAPGYVIETTDRERRVRECFFDSPTNLTPFPVSQISDVDIERIAKRTSELVLESMYLAFRKVG